eukprot:6455716-Alexandrium_andersonii.AAC.1
MCIRDRSSRSGVERFALPRGLSSALALLALRLALAQAGRLPDGPRELVVRERGTAPPVLGPGVMA